MKDYNAPFKNSSIDRLGDKFGKDKPTHQNVDFKANAEKRIQERADVAIPGRTGTAYNENITKISSLNNPNKVYYASKISDRGYAGNDINFSEEKAAYNEKKTGSSSLSYWSKKNQKEQVLNTHSKMRTLAPSYVDPKGPKTLQGVNSKKRK